MDDFRVKIGFLDHPKTVKLRRRLGSTAVECFLRLWEYCSIPGNDRTNGDLRGLSNEDIAIAAKWDGDEGDDAFVNALAEIGFLDKNGDGWTIHQWEEHNPYAAAHESRSKNAQKAIHARWVKEENYHQRTDWCTDDCLLTVYVEHTDRIRKDGESYTPTPYTPSVTPQPSTDYPQPITDPSTKSDALRADIIAVYAHYHTHRPDRDKIPNKKSEAWRRTRDRLKDGRTLEDLCLSIDGMFLSPYHLGENNTGEDICWLKNAMKAENIERFIEYAKNPPKTAGPKKSEAAACWKEWKNPDA